MSDAAGRPAVGRGLLVALGAVAALALLFGFVVAPLLFGDDVPATDVDVDVAVEPTDVPTPTPVPTGAEDFELVDPDDVDQDGDPPPETIEVFTARDPFQQLVAGDSVAGTAGTAGTTDGSIAPDPRTTGSPGLTPTVTATPSPSPSAPLTPRPDDGDDGDDDDGGGNGDGDDGDGSGDGGDDDDGGSGSDATVGGTTVSLVDVFVDDGEPQAIVTVNATGYTVGEDEQFADRFRVLDIAGECATLLFGDSRFTLCEGQRIRK